MTERRALAPGAVDINISGLLVLTRKKLHKILLYKKRAHKMMTKLTPSMPKTLHRTQFGRIGQVCTRKISLNWDHLTSNH